MLGTKAKRGAGLVALASTAGCHGGVTFQAVALLVTLGIFVGTILLDRT